jgi:hypothetical protein
MRSRSRSARFATLRLPRRTRHGRRTIKLANNKLKFAGLQRPFISAQNCDPSERVVDVISTIVSPMNDTLTATLDGFFLPQASIIGLWRGDGRASRSKSSSQRLTHRSSRNNDLHLSRRPRNRNGTPLHCPVCTSFSNSRRFRILDTGNCLKPLFQNSTGGWHAWAKSMVWLSLNISEV